MRTWKLSAAIAFLALVSSVMPVRAAPANWASEAEPDLGLSYSYPADVFLPIKGHQKPFFHYFASESAEAKFLVGGWDNSKGNRLQTSSNG
jgi:hypothetical protein